MNRTALRGAYTLGVGTGQNPPRARRSHATHYRLIYSHANDDRREASAKGKDIQRDVGLGLKSVWYGAEALGNVLAAFRDGQQNKNREGSSQETESHAEASLSRAEALELIRRDYDENYFISGQGDLSAYAPDCRFADPFASFRGTSRFKRNVSNLGTLLEDVSLEIIDWDEREDSLHTTWRFSGILDLPWKPRLAAAGGTVHVFDPKTGYVVEHIESWDVEPAKVVKNLLKPSTKVPSNSWQVLFNALHDGDVKGIWLSISAITAKLSAGLLVLSMGSALFTGEGLDFWPFALILLLAAIVTEVLKFSGGLQGGETGTGGRF